MLSNCSSNVAPAAKRNDRDNPSIAVASVGQDVWTTAYMGCSVVSVADYR